MIANCQYPNPFPWLSKNPINEGMNPCITWKRINASNDDISNPPMGGMMPLNIFKYGSVIEVNADNIPLLQSIPGNHVKSILIISKK